MDVTAKYELIGLMAYPIRHSLSPEMQNKALEKAGLPFTYMAFEVDNDSFPGAIEGLKALKMRGTGVSMPNKQLACEYVDELTPAAKLVGAINTIVNDDGYLRGYNTDGTAGNTLGAVTLMRRNTHKAATGRDIRIRAEICVYASGVTLTRAQFHRGKA